MASDKYVEGRSQALKDIAGIIKTERKNATEAELTQFTGSKKVFTKAETKAFLKDSLQTYYDIVQRDLSGLENGKDTGDLREVPPYETDDPSYEAGQISAYRDMYNIVEEIDTAEAMSSVPSTVTKLQKKKVALAQSNILAFARNELMKNIATNGQKIIQKYKQDKLAATQKETAAQQPHQQRRESTISQNFNTRNEPEPSKKNYVGINQSYVASFEEKNLPYLQDLDDNSQDYLEGLQDILTVIENYKSAIKKKDFSGITGFSMPTKDAGDPRTAEMAVSSGSFCRSHSHEVIRAVRESVVALMKGANPHKVCKKIPDNDSKKGREKAFSDVREIIAEINPAQFEVTHSHGFRLSVNPRHVSKMAASSAQQTTKELGSLVKALSNAENATMFLQTGILDTITGNRPANTNVASRIRMRRQQ